MDPVGIERGEAQRRALEELVKPRYEHEPLADRFLRIVQQYIDDLGEAVAGTGGGVIALIAVFVIIGALAALLLWHARKATRRAGASGGGIFAAKELTAAEHREAADRLAAAGEWAEAIRERLRAIARDLEERAIVAPLPGRTADELAAAAGRELPALARELAAASRLFDEVTYGAAPGTSDGYARLAELDERLRTAKPELPATAAPGAPR